MLATFRALTVPLLIVGSVIPVGAVAQTDASAAEPPREVSPAQRGTWDGMIAARGLATGGWLATGLLGGLVAGPIGTGIALAAASSRETPLPPDSLLTRPNAPVSGEYREAFTEAYRARIRSNRRTASLIGGVTGTAILGFVLLQLANWDGGSGSAGGGGGGELP